MGDLTSNRSYRIPAETDGAANMTDYWRNLGNDIDGDVAALYGRVPQIQFAPVSLSFSATAVATQAIVFPVPFNNTPVVECQIVSSSGSAIKATPLITVGPTTTGFTVRVDLAASATITIAVHWTAMAAF